MGHSAIKTPQASKGRVRRGVWGASPKKILNMKCFKSDSEQTSGTLEIFSRAIFLGTLLQFCEISEERVRYNLKFEILWCEYLWVATSPGGGFGGSRKLRNIKCSRSDLRPNEGTLSNSKFDGVNIYG